MRTTIGQAVALTGYEVFKAHVARNYLLEPMHSCVILIIEEPSPSTALAVANAALVIMKPRFCRSSVVLLACGRL